MLQARIIFWAVEMLRGGGGGRSVRQILVGGGGRGGGGGGGLSVWGNAGLRRLKGSPGLHFAIFEDGGSEFLLDVADAVGIISRYMRGTTAG